MRPLLYYKKNKVFFMSYAMPIFDTHRYVKELEAAGVETKQAEAQVKMQFEIFSSVIEDTVATKQDLRDTAAELKAEIAEVRTELKAEIAEVRTELKAEITEVRTELKTEIVELRTELKTDIAEVKSELKLEIAELRAEFTGKFNLLYWMNGFMLVLMSSVFFKLFLH